MQPSWLPKQAEDLLQEMALRRRRELDGKHPLMLPQLCVSLLLLSWPMRCSCLALSLISYIPPVLYIPVSLRVLPSFSPLSSLQRPLHMSHSDCPGDRICSDLLIVYSPILFFTKLPSCFYLSTQASFFFPGPTGGCMHWQRATTTNWPYE